MNWFDNFEFSVHSMWDRIDDHAVVVCVVDDCQWSICSVSYPGDHRTLGFVWEAAKEHFLDCHVLNQSNTTEGYSCERPHPRPTNQQGAHT